MLEPSRANNSKALLGLRLRTLRLDRRMTLVEVAVQCGISPSTLSKVENDKVSPTFANLTRLAEALGVPLAQVIGHTDPSVEDSGRGRIAVTRSDEVVFTPTPTCDIGTLCPNLRNKRMTPFYEKVHPPGKNLASRMVSHPGEEFIYVLEGEVQIHTEHYQPIVLSRGDSAYLDSRMAHTYCAGDRRETWMIVVHLPPENSDGDAGEALVRAINRPNDGMVPRLVSRGTTVRGSDDA